MWAELSRHSLAHRLLMAGHNIAPDPRNDAAKMYMIGHGQAANCRNMLVK